MSAQVGALRNIAVGIETTGGTPVTPTHWIPIEEGHVIPETEYAEDNSNYGRIEKPVNSEVVSENAIGNFNAVVRNDWIGMFLANLIGVPTSALANGESAVWEHDFFVLNTNAHAPLSMVYKDGITDEVSSYSFVRSLNFHIAADDILRTTIETIGRQLASDSNTVAYATSKAYTFTGTHATVKFGTAISDLSGASAIGFHELDLTITADPLAHQVFNSATLDKAINQRLTIEGELSLLHEVNTYRDYVTDNTVKAMQFLVDRTAQQIGVGETPSMQLQLAELSFESWELTEGIDGAEIEKIGFKAHFDPSESTPQMINVVLTNEENGDNFRA